ncbi:MAG: hypothetical protein ACLR43_13925 [Faecalibacillus faecis]
MSLLDGNTMVWFIPYCENRNVPVLGLVVLKQGNENRLEIRWF